MDVRSWKLQCRIACVAACLASGSALAQAPIQADPDLNKDLKAMDQDGDNSVSTEEFKESLPERAGLTPGEFKALDRDGDDRISRSESRADANLSQQFNLKDVDADGYVSPAELRGEPETP